MAPILYGNYGSTCVQRVRFTAAEKGVELDVKNLDWSLTKSPEHLARNPLGKFPALEDDGFVFHESRAITQYLEEKYKGQGAQLVPTDLKGHTLFNQWLSIESTELLPNVSTILSERIWGTWYGKKTDEANVAKAVEAAKATFDYLEKQLTGKDYILGDFSLIDIHLVPYFALLVTLPEKSLIESRPAVAAWWARVTARPAWKAAQPPAQ